MPTIVTCAGGHRLRVNERLAGRRVTCPKCLDKVLVPPVAEDEETILLLLSDTPQVGSQDEADAGEVNFADEPPMVLPLSRPGRKKCPKCQALVSASLDLCPHCRMYFSSPGELRRRLLGA